MNNDKLREKLIAAANSILKEKNFVSPVDILIANGALSSKDYEDWRLGRM